MRKNIDLLNGYRQHAPFMIEIEPTEGCNLGCGFCGLRGIRKEGKKPWRFMSVELAEKISEKIANCDWKSRICFCGHGEPTTNPQLLDIISVFRNALPENKMQLINNGYGFKNGVFDVRDFLTHLQKIRFNDVVFDVYSNNGDWCCVEQITDLFDIKIIGKDGEPFNYDKKRDMRVALYPLQVDAKTSILRVMDNHCGAAAPPDFSEKTVNKRCEKPFRYLFIRWDGEVCLCCDDFRGQYKIGNVLDFDTLDDLWNCERFQAARIALMSQHRRRFKPCLGCNYHSIRVGLLPDPSGKDKNVMPSECSEKVRQILKESYNAKGSTTIIKRKWEK